MINTHRLKQLAGIISLFEKEQVKIVESHDDDEDPDVKTALKDKRQAEFEKKHSSDIKKAEVAAKEKDEKIKEKKAPLKKTEAKTASVTPKAEDVKDEALKGEPKAVAAAVDKVVPDSAPVAEVKKAAKKAHTALAWLQANKGATRKDFMTWAKDHGMSSAHANTYFYLLKKRLTEGFVLHHSQIDKFVLSENRMMKSYVWRDISADADVDPMIFETEQEAKKMAKYMLDYNNQQVTIEKVTL